MPSTPVPRLFEYPAAAAGKAKAHFLNRLAVEVDPSDVRTDQQNKVKGFVVLDARTPQAYERSHLPGALSFWHRSIDKKSAAKLSKKNLHIVYCTGVGCNASTKAAAKLVALGFKVKEMIGGLDAWKSEGYDVVEGGGVVTV